MKQFLNLMSLIVFTISISFCSSQKQITTKSPQKIASVYYQGWVAGQEMGGSGINVYLKFEASTSTKFELKKIYFQDRETTFETSDNISYVARFVERPKKNNPITDGNSQTIISKKVPKLCEGLEPNQAIIEYLQENKVKYFKLENIKEKELLAYPSTRPRN